MKKILLFAFVSLVLFTTFKKYPEGGFTKRGPKNIIGGWKLDLYEVNGIDSTDLINYNNDEDYKRISFQKNASTISISAPHSGATTVHFTDDNRKLSFGNPNVISGKECILYQNINYCYRSFLIPEERALDHSFVWQIQKLTRNELILVTTSYKLVLSKG